MTEAAAEEGWLARYAREARHLDLSLLMVVPLLAAYEVAMVLVDSPVRNGAEMVLSELFRQVDPSALRTARWTAMGLLAVVGAAGVVRHRRRVARVHWVLLEALGFALVLGPVVGWMVGRIGLSVPSGDVSGMSLATAMLLSVGAGLWEEILFRFLLLGGLVVILRRAVGANLATAVTVAVVVSSLAFAFYHHVGDFGEPLELHRFAFRTVAGTLLGVLFATRGLAVVVYMHVFYDLLCDLRTGLGT